MSKEMEQYLIGVVDWMLGHGKVKAAEELSDMLDAEAGEQAA